MPHADSSRTAQGTNGACRALLFDVTYHLALAVLGDSIAFGQGADRREHTIAARLAAALDADGWNTTARVLAVPGARSTGLAAQVRSATAPGPDVAVIIIGANDLTHFVPPEDAARDLRAAVRGLRAAGAEVVVAPAPDLSAVPWVPEQMRELVRA